VVLRDAVDDGDFDEVLATSARLGELVEQGARLLPDFEALIGDLFAALVKLNVKLAPRQSLPASARVRHRLVADLVGTEAFAELRDVTALKPPAAGFAALSVGRSILDNLKRGRLLSARELGELWRLEDGERRRGELASQLESADALKGEGAAVEGHADAVSAIEEELEALDETLEAAAQDLDEALDGVPTDAMNAIADAAGRGASDLSAAEGVGQGLGGPGGGGAVDSLALHAELAKRKGLRRLLALVGALRDEARAARRRRVPRARTEVYGVELGTELERLLPVELLALRHPALRRDMLRRLVEGELLGYRMRGDDREGRGPAIFLLDVSGSMAGQKVVWAKAVVLAMAELARREGRRAAVLAFSSGVVGRIDLAIPRRGHPRVEVEWPGMLSLADLAVGGGTDFEGPLRAALGILRDERDYQRADIVIVTDGEARVTSELLAELEAETRLRDNRILGVLVDVAGHARQTLEALCHEVVTVEELSVADATSILRRF